MKKAEVKELRSMSIQQFRCRDCGNIQDDNMTCKKCSQYAKGFDVVQKRFSPDAPSKEYTVLENISYDGNYITKGELINLADEDPATPSLLKRKLIEPVKKGK